MSEQTVTVHLSSNVIANMRKSRRSNGVYDEILRAIDDRTDEAWLSMKDEQVPQSWPPSQSKGYI